MFNREQMFKKDEFVAQGRERQCTVAGTSAAPTPAPARRPLAEPPKPEAPAKPAPTRESEAKGSRLIVGPDIKLKGAEITDCDTLVVEGRVEAAMDSRVIQIAEQGVFSGTVGIDIAEIHGRFEGELTARKHLVIHATGKVTGKVRYGKLTIEEGGELSGDIGALNAPEPCAGNVPPSRSRRALTRLPRQSARAAEFGEHHVVQRRAASPGCRAAEPAASARAARRAAARTPGALPPRSLSSGRA